MNVFISLIKQHFGSVLIATSILLAAIIYSNSPDKFSKSSEQIKSPQVVSKSINQTNNAPNLSTKELYDQRSPLIVSVISLDRCGFPYSSGSGVILGPSKAKFISTDGNSEGTDIVTNFHVIYGSYLVLVKTSDGKIRYAQILYFDRKTDLAVIRIHGRFTNEETPFAKSVSIGEPAIAIGNPQGFSRSISTGIISRLPDGKNSIVQTTAPISHGSSGGGLFNQSGDLIGITSSFIADGQNLNFAIWMQGAVLNEIQNYRKNEGHIWNDAQAGWLEIPFIFGKYPKVRYMPINESGVFDPQAKYFEKNKYFPDFPVFKNEDELKKYVEEKALDPQFAKYFIGKIELLNLENAYNEFFIKITDDPKYTSLPERGMAKVDSLLEEYKTNKILPKAAAFYSEFPYDEKIASLYIGFLQDPSAKEALLAECFERWPLSIGEGGSANWLFQYINTLVSLGKLQKAHEILSETVNHLSVEPPKYSSDDDQTAGVLQLFNSDSEINRRFLFHQVFKPYIQTFPSSIKGFSFQDIKDQVKSLK